MHKNAPSMPETFDDIDFDPIDEISEVNETQPKQAFVMVVEGDRVVSVKQKREVPPLDTTPPLAAKLGAHSLGQFFNEERQDTTRKLDGGVLDNFNECVDE